MTNLIVRVLLGLEPLSSEATNVRPEALVKGCLQLNIDAVLQCRSVIPAVHGHSGVTSMAVSCDQPVESDLSGGVVVWAGDGCGSPDETRTECAARELCLQGRI